MPSSTLFTLQADATPMLEALARMGERLAALFAPLATAMRPALESLLARLQPPPPGPHPARDRMAFMALAARTTARHQRRNRAGRHK